MLPGIAEIWSVGRQIDQLMELPEESRVTYRARPKAVAPSQLTLTNVQYRYPGGTEPAIRGLNLVVEPGELLGVVGQSGSGKSTILRIMQGLLRPQAGLVALNGVNLRQLSLDAVREQVGFVRQVPVFFHGTVAQNLRLAAPGATDDRIFEILQELGLVQLIEALPHGLDTRLSEVSRTRLSQGARQALSVARVMLSQRNVLLLDEPEQGLDPGLDAALMRAIEFRRRQSTIVMVSHRPSHLAICDRVLDLDRGQIRPGQGMAASRQTPNAR